MTTGITVTFEVLYLEKVNETRSLGCSAHSLIVTLGTERYTDAEVNTAAPAALS